jgi:hypothetical protein
VAFYNKYGSIASLVNIWRYRMSSFEILKSDDNGFSVQINFKFNKSMLKAEEEILEKLNEVGSIATGKMLAQFDSDGSPIKIGNQTFTSKGLSEKNYQTPWGEARVTRHVYQSHSGGKTYCPLENDARIIITSTPRFAKIVSSKYSDLSTESVKKDLSENHGRIVQRKTIQSIGEVVGIVAIAKETSWEYVPTPNELTDKVDSISIGLDGTCMQMREDGWREAMTGTVSLYNKDGERLHTTYVACSPEYGKEKFLNKLENAIVKIKDNFPKAKTIGLADGAKCNWTFLEKHTKFQVLDFFHASEYLGSYSKAVFKEIEEQKNWLSEACHELKNEKASAVNLLNIFQNELLKKHVKADKETIETVATYYKNNCDKMNYSEILEMKLPIGSGVTEAACKVIVKERMCKAGMRWNDDGAHVVLKLRSLNKTDGSWNHFWGKVDKVGFNMAA